MWQGLNYQKDFPLTRMLPLLILFVLPHLSTSGSIFGKDNLLAIKANCGSNEVFRTCGPKCPPTCDTLKDVVCCEVACVSGCFCADGYMLESKNGPRKCVPVAKCPNPGVLRFEKKSVEFLEEVKVARIHVIRVNGSLGKVTVRWRIVGPSPYQGESGVLVFPDGVISQNVEIPIENDEFRSPDVTFQIDLFDPSNKAEIAAEFSRIIVRIIDDDMKPGYPEMERSDEEVRESVGTAKVNVIRVGGSDGRISVMYKIIPGTAKDLKDFTSTTGELTFEEGEDLKPIFISITDDNVREKAETFHVQLFDPKAHRGVLNFKPLGVRMTTTVTIKDDDMNPGFLELEKENIIVEETVGKVRVKIVRKQGTDGQLKIRYKTVESTAKPNLDFRPTEGELVFEEGEKFKFVDVPIIDDNIFENTESCRFKLFDPSTGPDVINFRDQAFIRSTEITITDNDMKPGITELEKSEYIISEDAGTITICVVRFDGSDGEIRVFYKTVAKTAQAGQDFIPVRGVLIFKDGETLKCFTLQLVNDNIREPTEIFDVVLFDTNAAPNVINFKGLGSKKKATITIQDDDMQPGSLELEQPVFTFPENVGTVRIPCVRRFGSDGTIRVKYKTVPKTAQVDQDFQPVTGELVFKEGETIKFISVRITNDNVREHSEIFEVILFDSTAGPDVLNFHGIGSITTTTIEITDDDMKPGRLEIEKPTFIVSENVGAVRVGVVRLDGSDEEIRASYKTVSKTALTGQDFRPTTGELVFKEGETLKYIVVPIIDDDFRESSETFEIVLYGPSVAPGVLNFRGLGSRKTATITITDDDMKPGYLEFDDSTYVVSENVGTIRYGVRRVGGSDGEIRVLFKTESRTAQAGQDFKPVNGQLVFKDGETHKFISMAINDDNIREPTEVFDVVLYDPSAAHGVINFRGLGPRKLATVTINDDDMSPGFLQMEKPAYVVSENIGIIRIGVVRIGGTDGQIRVHYRTIPRTALPLLDFEPMSGELVFEEGENVKHILVPIKNDEIREPSKNFAVEIHDSTPGPNVINFRGIGQRVMSTVTISDDDMKPGFLECGKPSYVVSENVGTVNVEVTRVDGSDGGIRVRYKTIAKSASDRFDFEHVDGELDFTEGETRKFIPIRIINDNVKETAETFEVLLYDPTPGPGVINFKGIGSMKTTVITINDDDTHPGVLEMEQASVAVPEDVGVAQVTVVRTGGDDGRLVVRYTTVDGTAQAGLDYFFTSGIIELENGEIRQTVTIPIMDDKEKEPVESFQVQIFTDDNPGSVRSTTVTIIDNDETPGTFDFRDKSVSVQEGEIKAVLTVIRTNGMDGSVTLNWRTIDGTAKEGFDYRGRQGFVTFNEGETEKTFSIEIVDDLIKEDDEQFVVGLFDPTQGKLGHNNMATVTIRDNDDSNVKASDPVESKDIQTFFTNPLIRVSKGSSDIRFKVRRTGDLKPMKFFLETQDGSARAGIDYRQTKGPVQFGENEIELTIKTRLIENTNSHGTKFFLVKLKNPSEGIIVPGKDVLTVLISDDTPKFGESIHIETIPDPGFVVSGTKTETFSHMSIREGGFTGSTSDIKIPSGNADFTGTSGIKTSGINGGFSGTSGSTGGIIKTSGSSSSFTETFSSGKGLAEHAFGSIVAGSNVDVGMSGVKTSGIDGGIGGTSFSTGDLIKTSGNRGSFTGASGSFSGSVTGTQGASGSVTGTQGASGSVTGTQGASVGFGGKADANREVGVSGSNRGNGQVVQTAHFNPDDFKESGANSKSGGKTKKCPVGMTRKPCANVCPKSCATLHNKPCNKKCIDACFCPDGLVIENLRTLRCIPPSQCKAQATVVIPKASPAVGGGLLDGLGGLGGLFSG